MRSAECVVKPAVSAVKGDEVIGAVRVSCDGEPAYQVCYHDAIQVDCGPTVDREQGRRSASPDSVVSSDSEIRKVLIGCTGKEKQSVGIVVGRVQPTVISSWVP